MASNADGSEGTQQLVDGMVGLFLDALEVAPVDSADYVGVGAAGHVPQYSRTLGSLQSGLAIYYRVPVAAGHKYGR